jgi:hypothetical protein
MGREKLAGLSVGILDAAIGVDDQSAEVTAIWSAASTSSLRK